MSSFTVKFKIDGLTVSGIVTPVKDGGQYKIELFTGDKQPVILNRNGEGMWSVESKGKWNDLTEEEIQRLGRRIDEHLNKDLSTGV